MAEKPTTPRWERVGPLADLEPGTLTTFKRGGAQLVLARTAEGEVHALDNRCPHEGYPLAQGKLDGTSLTCCWHNWKFDVRDGACTLGEEPVRAYALRVVDGEVEVDLAEPPPESFFPGWKLSLERGLFRRETARCLRDGVRLLDGGYEPGRLLADLAAYDGRHAEYGSTHVLPLAADLGRSLGRYRGTRAMAAIAPVVDLCSEGDQRLPAHPTPELIAGADAASLRAAVEGEELERALGLLAGAFAEGVSRATIEGWLYGCLSDHFLDFGHQLIYLVKARELLDRGGEDHAPDVYAGLLRSIVLGTREDTLPYMRPHARRLAAIEGALAEVHGRARADALFDPIAARDAVLEGSNDEAFDAVWTPLRAGVPAARVAAALVGAGAHRLLRFDTQHERDPSVAENWLWATHRFTFVSAVRNAVERFDSPDALRFLFQAVMFVHSGRAMDLPPGRRLQVAEEDAGLEQVLDAVRSTEAEAAVCRTLGFLAAGGAPEDLEAGLVDLCLDGRFVRPIFEAHGIKTTVAAFEEYAALSGHPDRSVPVAAAVRFLASPVSERSLQAAVATSIAWIVDGRVPRKLTQ